MESQRGRRSFLTLMGLAASSSMLMAAGKRVDAADPPSDGDESSDLKAEVYKGTSKKGDLQEALDFAIKAAVESAPGADRMATWRLKEVAGREGGIAGFNEVTVSIYASIS